LIEGGVAVLREAVGLMTKRWNWLRYRRALDRMTTMDQFTSLMARLQDPIFRQYEQWDSIALRREEVRAVLESLKVDVRGGSFLDIGPGFGSTLDAVKERGAQRVEFAEYNPFFYTYNRIKGFTGHPIDARKELKRVGARRFDVVWVKQTFVADRFILREGSGGWPLLSRYPRLTTLLGELESLTSAGGLIIFCPHWLSSNGRRRIPDVMGSSVSHICHANGYRSLPYLKGHNLEPMAPVTFYKRVADGCGSV
jgi:hypothetical protein